MTTRHLSLAEVLEIHSDQLARFGGKPGIRDIELLQTTVCIPATDSVDKPSQNDIFEIAATYFCHLIQNHPFVDGNMRVGAVAAMVFLILNGFDFQGPEVDFFVLVMGVSQGLIEKPAVALFIRRWAKEIP